MKRTLIILIMTAILTASCRSVRPEDEIIPPPPQKEEENITSVNTTLSENGKMYSVCVFDELKKVEIVDNEGKTVKELSLSEVTYNPVTTELKFASPVNKAALYKISGTYSNPPDFVVNNYTWAPPLVLFNGKKGIQGKDYVWNRQNLTIHFNTELDMEKDSYEIVWFTVKGNDVLANNDELYKKEYDTYINRYFMENPRW